MDGASWRPHDDMAVTEAPMPDLVRSPLADHADREQFRAAVAALPAGPLRDVLIAVAYARDAAARTGASAAPDDRWQAVVAAAERAAVGVALDVTREVTTEFAPRLVAVA